MKHTISRSKLNLKFLNNILVEEFYKGFVGPEKFELVPNRFPNNYRLVGEINENDSFNIKLDWKQPIKTALVVFLAIGILASTLALIKGIWIPSFIFSISVLIIFADLKLKEKKEINQLVNQLLKFHKNQSE
ncbi:MAG: hypothetical protein AB8B72_13610 [Crocinitomicaceae bacterium]